MIVRTPSEGLVVEVRISLGQLVDEDEILVMIENKSMDGIPEAIHAPASGEIVEIHVAEGDRIQYDDELVTLQASDPDDEG